jgi:hypothetical protein
MLFLMYFLFSIYAVDRSDEEVAGSKLEYSSRESSEVASVAASQPPVRADSDFLPSIVHENTSDALATATDGVAAEREEEKIASTIDTFVDAVESGANKVTTEAAEEKIDAGDDAADDVSSVVGGKSEPSLDETENTYAINKQETTATIEDGNAEKDGAVGSGIPIVCTYVISHVHLTLFIYSESQ